MALAMLIRRLVPWLLLACSCTSALKLTVTTTTIQMINSAIQPPTSQPTVLIEYNADQLATDQAIRNLLRQQARHTAERSAGGGTAKGDPDAAMLADMSPDAAAALLAGMAPDAAAALLAGMAPNAAGAILAAVVTDDHEVKTDDNEVKADSNEIKADEAEIEADKAEIEADQVEVKADDNEVKADKAEIVADANKVAAVTTVKISSGERAVKVTAGPQVPQLLQP